MAFALIQADGKLVSVNSQGGLSSPLTLPAGVQLATNLTPRFAKFKQYVVVVNTPTRALSVDTSGVVRVLTPAAPSAPVVLSAGSASTLTGTYKALETFQVRDSLGNLISESAPSPLMSTPVTITNQSLNASFQLSADTISNIELYRTTTNGSVYFPWRLVPGNSTSSISNDATADAALGTVPIANLGTAPDLTLIAEFGGRLFGVDRGDVDDLRWTEAGTMYAWSALNSLPIPHVGSDAAGITALIPRRNALGVTRRDMFLQVTGNSTATFSPQPVFGGEMTGCLSQESVVVYNDMAFFLWRDGVYTWDNEGVKCITNGKVRSWFSTDNYFNRAMFWRAFANLDPATLKYRLFLASAGSTTIDRWIEYDLTTSSWWGPHKTDAFSPTSAVLVPGSNMEPYFMIGSAEGYLSLDQEPRNDWDVVPINMSVLSKRQDVKQPDYEKYFGEVSIIGKSLSGTTTITPTVGEIDNPTVGAPFTWTMTNGRQRLGRIGVGKHATLQFDNANLNEDVVIYGYEINPTNIVGRR